MFQTQMRFRFFRLVSLLQIRNADFIRSTTSISQPSWAGLCFVAVGGLDVLRYAFQSNAYMQQEHMPVADIEIHGNLYPKCASASSGLIQKVMSRRRLPTAMTAIKRRREGHLSAEADSI